MRSLSLPFLFSFPIRLFAGLFKPKRIRVLGQECAGIVEAAGGAVHNFKTGDRVFVVTGFSMGANAEYICLPVAPPLNDAVVAEMPSNATFEEAAAVPTGGLEALYFLRRATVKEGERMLVIGAGGSIGTIAVQLGRYFGADVTAVDSTEKLSMLRSIGANAVIDYTNDNIAAYEGKFDIVFDVVGTKRLSGNLKLLKANGRYLLANPKIVQVMGRRRISRRSGRELIVGAAARKTEELSLLKDLMEAKKIKPVIDKVYALEQTGEAHRYVESGRKMGNVVVRVVQAHGMM